MKYTIFNFCLYVVLCGMLYAQEERVIAKVGAVNIYESEFKDRFDFSAHPNLLQKNEQLKAKEEFLHQLIAEKLLSLDAREKGYDTSEEFYRIITPLKNMFVRDALYTREIKNKMSCGQNEIIKGIEWIQKSLKVKFIYSDKHDEIQSIFGKLKRGSSFDSLLALRIESSENPRQVTFGTMDEQAEDSLYNLKPGQFTYPIQVENGYYILKLIEVDINPDLKNTESAYQDAKKIVETRAEYKQYQDFYHDFFKDFRVTADKEIFEKLIKIFIPAFNKKYADQNGLEQSAAIEKNANKFYLKGDEINSAINKLDSDSRNKSFIQIDQHPVNAVTFLYQLSQDGFYVKDIREKNIRASLSSYIRKFIEDQLLSAEAYKEGLEDDPRVKRDIKMWEDSYLSKMLMIKMFDSVRTSEDQAYTVYKQNDWKETPPQLTNIAEVLTDSLTIAEKVLNELSNGVSIKDLARQYTRRDSLKEKGGEFGYFNITQHGEIGRIASQLKVGDIYGPLKLDEGYSIFQVTGKKDDTTSYTMSFDEVKDQLIAKITLSKFEKYVNDYNAGLAGKYGVEIYDNVLNNTDNIFMNLVVARYMGFGGEIYAVPYTEQYSGWYDIWIKNKNIVQ